MEKGQALPVSVSFSLCLSLSLSPSLSLSLSLVHTLSLLHRLPFTPFSSVTIPAVAYTHSPVQEKKHYSLTFPLKIVTTEIDEQWCCLCVCVYVCVCVCVRMFACVSLSPWPTCVPSLSRSPLSV